MTEQDIYKLLADGERVTLECKGLVGSEMCIRDSI